MGIIKYFEKSVEKKANRMLKHKRLYAWLLLMSVVAQALKLFLQIKKLWDEDWEHAWIAYWKERREKKRKVKEGADGKCPYKTEGVANGNEASQSEDTYPEDTVDLTQA